MASINEQIEDRIEALRRIQSDLQWLNELPYEVNLSPSGYLLVELPFDRVKMDLVKADMVMRGFHLAYERNVLDTAAFGEGYQAFCDSEKHEIAFSWPVWKEGATCKRVKIGAKPEDIYELVCTQAEEMAAA